MSKKAILDEEWQAWRGFRRMAEIITGRIADDITKATGLSAADFSVLVHLSEAEDGFRRQRDLQTFLEWDRTRLSHQLTRMAGRGLIKRIGSAAGNGVQVEITEEGSRLLRMAKPIHMDGVRIYFLSHLTEDELLHLRNITGKLRNALLK